MDVNAARNTPINRRPQQGHFRPVEAEGSVVGSYSSTKHKKWDLAPKQFIPFFHWKNNSGPSGLIFRFIKRTIIATGNSCWNDGEKVIVE